MIVGYEIKESEVVFERLKDLYIAVGILSGETVHPGNSKKKLEDLKATIAEVATYNEFGTTNKDGDVILKARPFLRDAFEGENRQILKNLVKEGADAIATGEASQDSVIDIIGLWAVDKVKESMVKYGVIDTGITKAHINYTKTDKRGEDL